MSSTDGLAGDILVLSTVPQNLRRTEKFFLSKSKKSLNHKIWKLFSPSWMLLCYSTKCWHISGAGRHGDGKFLAFISAGGVCYKKGFVMNLKLHCAKLIDTSAKADASSLVSDQIPCLERNLLFYFFLVFSGIICHLISVSCTDAAHI